MRGHAGKDAAGAGLPHPGVQENAEGGSNRLGSIVGVLVALAVSAGLAWFIGRAPDAAHGARVEPVPRAVPSVQRRYAPAEPNAAQVAAAYEQAREVYAQGGAESLSRASEDCLASLEADGRVLDYCLGLANFSDAILGKPASEVARGERLAAARAALPEGADAAARLAAVQALTRTAGASAATAPEKEARRPARAEPRPAVKAAAAKARGRSAAERAKATAARCRLMSTPAERVLCADARLRAADRRMRAAYSRAIAGGSSWERRRLLREQAAFRTELHAAAPDRRRVAALYERRIRELQASKRR